MKNVTLDRTTVLQLDADGTDRALDAAADCEDLRWTIAFDVADNRHAGADARACSHLRRLQRRRGVFYDRVLLLRRASHHFGRICHCVLFLIGCFALEHVHLRFPTTSTAEMTLSVHVVGRCLRASYYHGR